MEILFSGKNIKPCGAIIGDIYDSARETFRKVDAGVDPDKLPPPILYENRFHCRVTVDDSKMPALTQAFANSFHARLKADPSARSVPKMGVFSRFVLDYPALDIDLVDEGEGTLIEPTAG